MTSLFRTGATRLKNDLSAYGYVRMSQLDLLSPGITQVNRSKPFSSGSHCVGVAAEAERQQDRETAIRYSQHMTLPEIRRPPRDRTMAAICYGRAARWRNHSANIATGSSA